MTMNTALIISNEVTINAPAAKVWRTLTDGAETRKYMYGCETISDWQPGSPLLWQGKWEDRDMVFVKGHVVAIQPDKYLEYTTFDPNNATIPDVPENYLTVTYTLSQQNGATTLLVTQGDYTKVAQGEKRYNDAAQAGGWSSILTLIKDVAESA
jgi:uncharacterized protein YndB with AHSA1/START domain